MMLSSDRLILRPFNRQDTIPFIVMNQDSRVMEYMPSLLSDQESLALLEQTTAHWVRHGFGRFACILKETGTFIGYVGLVVPTFNTHFTPCIGIEWRFAFDYWGKGYALEAAQLVLAYAFTQLDLSEINAWTVPSNIRSINLIKKLDMHHDSKDDFEHPKLPEGHKLRYHILYRLTKKEWLTRSFAKNGY